jgi:hypothetical protein
MWSHNIDQNNEPLDEGFSGVANPHDYSAEAAIPVWTVGMQSPAASRINAVRRARAFGGGWQPGGIVCLRSRVLFL